MREYEFHIKIETSVLPGGRLFPEKPVFSCTFMADKTIDGHYYGARLFDFWKESNLLGNAQQEWTYDWNIVQL